MNKSPAFSILTTNKKRYTTKRKKGKCWTPLGRKSTTAAWKSWSGTWNSTPIWSRQWSRRTTQRFTTNWPAFSDQAKHCSPIVTVSIVLSRLTTQALVVSDQISLVRCQPALLLPVPNRLPVLTLSSMPYAKNLNKLEWFRSFWMKKSAVI